jgi:large subunit ribosomal protein L17
MRHLHAHKKIGRPTDQRLALLKYQTRSLIQKGEITTTLAKAKALVSFVQKLVSFVRQGDVAGLREVRKQIDDRRLILKLTQEIVPKLKPGNGGEVSVIHAGRRRGDGSPIAIITFNVNK